MKNGVSIPAFTERWTTCNKQPTGERIYDASGRHQGGCAMSPPSLLLLLPVAVSFFLFLPDKLVLSFSPSSHNLLTNGIMTVIFRFGMLKIWFSIRS